MPQESGTAVAARLDRTTIYFVAEDRALSDSDYQHLLQFRTELRRFHRWSEEQAQVEGLTPAQHQLLLAVRGSTDPDGATIGEVADALFLRHHTATELVDRAESAGLLRRERDRDDHRVVRLRITRSGAAKLARLSRQHLDELGRLRAGIL
jgi:DNA-binding MarR family transcriptional regulator